MSRFYTDDDRFWITDQGRRDLHASLANYDEIENDCRHSYRVMTKWTGFGRGYITLVCDVCGDEDPVRMPDSGGKAWRGQR